MPAITAVRRSGSALSALSRRDHHVMARAAGAVDDGDGLLLGRLGLAGARPWRLVRPVAMQLFAPGGLRIARRLIGSPPSGLSLKMREAREVTRKRPSSTASACIPVNGNRNRRLRAPSPARAACSDRRPSLPWTSPNQPGRRYHGGARPRQMAATANRNTQDPDRIPTTQQKGRPEGRPFQKPQPAGTGSVRGLVGPACRSRPCRRWPARSR